MRFEIIHPYGPRAVLLRFADQADEAAFHKLTSIIAAIEAAPPAHCIEWVPALTTVLLIFDESATHGIPQSVASLVTRIPTTSGRPHGEPPTIREIPTLYQGPDLERVASMHALEQSEVIERHTAPTYYVHCLGFSPGFPYLTGLDPRLATPRLASPRLRVDAGSIAIGGEHTGIYPTASPGGWNVIGRTPLRLFHPTAASADTIFLLRLGDRVRFRRIDSAEFKRIECEEHPAGENSSGDTTRTQSPFLKVVAAGHGLSIQDSGRTGWRRYGVPPGGVMDSCGAAAANRLLSNPTHAPLLELCLFGQQFLMEKDAWVAAAGACHRIRIQAGTSGESRIAPANSALPVRAGELLEFLAGPAGIWTYVAVPGGIRARSFLGSASCCARAGIGRQQIAGDLLYSDHYDNNRSHPQGLERAIVSVKPMSYVDRLTLPVWPAPQSEKFSITERERFFGQGWTVTGQCDRAGYRLSGIPLEPPPGSMISEPVLPGSVQIPPNGQPIVTMPDGPTLGGYPKIGLIDATDLLRLAQCRPGQKVTFTRMDLT